MKLVNVLTHENKAQIEQLFRVMCFNVFTHNLDDHTKNFSFVRNDTGWELAPAYDLTYSNTYYGEHTTSINGKGINITEEDLIIVGKKANLKLEYMEEAISLVKDIVSKRLNKYLK
jgi:serine/threonine-protein kinase HipA